MKGKSGQLPRAASAERGMREFERRDAQQLQIVDQAFADARSRAGEHLVCRAGCNQCCHGAFAISPTDAHRLRAEMMRLQTEEPAKASRINERATTFLGHFGALYPGNQTTGVLGTSEADAEAFEDFANDAPCPALDPQSGLCEVYAARPITCRVFGPPIRQDEGNGTTSAFSVCELCFTTASPEEVAAAAMVVPLEEQSLLPDMQNSGQAKGATIVAFCLLETKADRLPTNELF